MSETTSIETGKRPEEISRSPSEWIRQNLFSNLPNTILTIVFGVFALSFIIAGCNIDASSFEDCKDKDGKPLPEWVCRKGDPDSKPSE